MDLDFVDEGNEEEPSISWPIDFDREMENEPDCEHVVKLEDIEIAIETGIDPAEQLKVHSEHDSTLPS